MKTLTIGEKGDTTVQDDKVLVDDEDGLRDIVTVCMASSCVGLDTEFVWERTYYPRLGIVQVSVDDGRCFLIDVPALKDLAPLGEVLESPSVVKVLHDAPQDLTILRRESGAFPRNIFDTRVAAGFCGYRATLSLQDLLKATLDVSLSKSETRTDWLRRPLSAKQLDYAVDDVEYLIALREYLVNKAEAMGRVAWLQEELEAFDAPDQYEERDPDIQYTRVRGAGRLNAAETAVLQALAAWREHTARTEDLPRGHVMPDDALIQAARRKPRRAEDLRSIRALTPPLRERFGQGVVDAVAEGLEKPPIRASNAGGQPTPREDVRSDFALAYVRGKSLDEGIDPALVGTKQDVRSLVDGGRNGDGEANRLLQGWRRAFVGQDLLEILDGKRSVGLGKGRKVLRSEA